MKEPADPTDAEAILDREIEKAGRYLEIDRADDARRIAERALAAYPDDARLLTVLARALLCLDDIEGASRASEAALAAAPDQPRVLGLHGLIMVEQRRYSDAEAVYLDALARDPEDPWLFMLYGDLMRRFGQLDKAEALYRSGLALAPEFSALHSRLALIGSERGGGGTTAAQKALQLDPDELMSHVSMGSSLLASGRPFAARAHLRTALRLDPSRTNVIGLFEQADRCCRLVYLPMYYWSLLLEKLPGRQFAIWGVFIVMVTFVMPRLGVSGRTITIFSWSYIGFCIYTWAATPLVRLAIKIRPPR